MGLFNNQTAMKGLYRAAVIVMHGVGEFFQLCGRDGQRMLEHYPRYPF